MEIKKLNKQDFSKAKDLWAYAFETDEPFYSWYYDTVYDPNNCIGIYDDDLVSYLQLNPYVIRLHNRDFHCSYVVGVITAAEYRNRGAMKNLLPESLKLMNDKGHYISILMPFDTDFYSTYGWELTYSQLNYTVNIEQIKKFRSKSGDFKRLSLSSDFSDLNHIYESYLSSYEGYVKRHKGEWNYIMKEVDSYGGHMYILYINEKPCGYIFYYIENKTFSIREMAYTNLDSMNNLFSFIYSHTSQANKVSWPAPLEDKLHLKLKDTIKPDYSNDIKLRPFMCTRVVNVKKAIEHCYFHESCEFNFTIDDTYAPWNNNTYNVLVKNNKATVTVVDSCESDFEMNINTFSQLFFGSMDINEALFFENIQVKNMNKIYEFNKIFNKKKLFINEYF